MRVGRVLPALLLAVFCAAAPARAAIITFESLTVNQGDSFSLGILVTDVTDLYTFQFDLAFNPSVLSATLVFEGPLLASAGETFFIAGSLPADPPDDENPAGLVRETANSLIGDSPGVSVPEGTPTVNLLPIAFVTFMVIAAGDPGITLSNVFLFDSSFPMGNPIDTTIENGTVTVVPSASVPEPATLVLMGVGLLTMARGLRRRRG